MPWSINFLFSATTLSRVSWTWCFSAKSLPKGLQKILSLPLLLFISVRTHSIKNQTCSIIHVIQYSTFLMNIFWKMNHMHMRYVQNKLFSCSLLTIQPEIICYLNVKWPQKKSLKLVEMQWSDHFHVYNIVSLVVETVIVSRICCIQREEIEICG